MYKCITIGTSAGGIDALKTILKGLPKPFPFPIIVVQHLSPKFESYLPKILETISGIPCKEADDKDNLENNHIYIAPPNYHLLVEKDFTLSLSTDHKVCYARPSIDVTLETASDAFRTKLIGILLTGANHDGALGMKKCHDLGGLTIVQNPKTAHSSEMPQSALREIEPDYILKLEEIREMIIELANQNKETNHG